MDRYVRVDNYPNLVRDRETGAVLNINTEEIKKKRQQKMLAKQQAHEINELKNEVSELKSLLRQLLEKSKDG
jgi:hypothetical protein